MLLHGLFLSIQLVLVGLLVYEKVFLERFKFQFTSWFLLIYYLTLVVVPFAIVLFFDGFRRINTAIQDQYFDLGVIYILNMYQLYLLIGFYIVRFLKSKPCSPWTVFPEDELKFYFRIMSLISCLGLVIFLYAVGSNPLALISAGRFSWFLDPTANIFLVAISQYFIAAVMLVCALFILVGKTKLNIFIFVVVLLVVVSYSLISLDRKFIIFFVSGSFAGIYLKNNQKLNLTKKTITVSSLLFGFMILSQMARDLLARYLTIDNMSPAAYLYGFKDQVVYFIEYGDISYFYRASLESIAISLEEGILAPGALVIRNLLFFLPSSITFGIKPPDISATFSVYVNGAAGGRAGNMPPGVFGLYVASFGVYWSAMLLVSLPFCLRMLDNLVRKSRFWAFVLGSTCLSSSLFFMRGDDSTAIYFPLFIALCLGFSMLAYRLTWGSYALSKNR